MLRRLYLIIILLITSSPLIAEDSIPPQKKGVIGVLYDFVKEFSRVDTNYVEPQRYNFAAMIQNTNTYEVYRLSSSDGMNVVFAPKPRIKVGPYFGWRWIFLGYTLDVAHIKESGRNQDFNLSLYSNQIGVDLFYRRTGDNYKIKEIDVGRQYDTEGLKDLPFDGIEASIKGFNLYYIFNDRKFSYPAAYSQSTVQRRSAGSFMAGIGYTRHGLNMDWMKLSAIIKQHTGYTAPNGLDANRNLPPHIDYTDYSISGGYAYNWVPMRNLLIDASLSIGLSYKTTRGDNHEDKPWFKQLSLHNTNIDAIGRMGIVWNNTKWFVGANAVFHSYNYHKSQITTNNTFGNVNIYIGFNFDRR